MATQTLTLTVSLKIPDNEARSALEALRVKMGLGDEVRGLEREEVWELSFADGGAASMARVRHIVESTNLFANPNKHRYTLAEGRAADVSLEPDQVAILVSERGGGEARSKAASLERLGAVGVVGVRRWVRWLVTLSHDEAREERRMDWLIHRMGVADARDAGLFCNPHVETAVAVLPSGAEKPLAL